MFDKVLCPWCGAEMKPHGIVMYETRNNEHPRYIGECWCSGKGCEASGPCVQNKDEKGFATREEAKEAARAAALQRYTPPLKPLTLEEVRENDNGQMWLELNNPKHAYMQGYCELIIFRLFDGYEQFDFYPCGSDMAYDYKAKDYNREWRCWERKPTDEERSAAEWETI